MPVVCVVDTNDLPWIHDEIDRGIDLVAERHDRECSGEECDYCAWGEYDQGETLIGSWLRDGNGDPTPDFFGDYAAIYLPDWQAVQVIWSKFTANRGWASPCFPGQTYYGADGNIESYVLPDYLMDDES